MPLIYWHYIFLGDKIWFPFETEITLMTTERLIYRLVYVVKYMTATEKSKGKLFSIHLNWWLRLVLFRVILLVLTVHGNTSSVITDHIFFTLLSVIIIII